MADEPRQPPPPLFTFRFLGRRIGIQTAEAFELVDWLPAANDLTQRIILALREPTPEVELTETDRDVLLKALKPHDLAQSPLLFALLGAMSGWEIGERADESESDAGSRSFEDARRPQPGGIESD